MIVLTRRGSGRFRCEVPRRLTGRVIVAACQVLGRAQSFSGNVGRTFTSWIGRCVMDERIASVVLIIVLSSSSAACAHKGLLRVYDDELKRAKYIDLTHIIAPNIPVWYGFGPSK